MTRTMRAAAAIALLVCLAQGGAQASPSWVEFPSGEVRLRAALYLPAGAGPHPAVIALHGCGGFAPGSARVRAWTSDLTGAGFAVLFPDSFGSRGLKSQCNVRDRQVRATRERIGDAQAALAYLQTRPDIKPAAISLLGWSNGGSTIISAVRPQRRPADARHDFARAIAFYPGCNFELKRGGWTSRLPLLLLAGGADDWTPAAPCEELAKGQPGVTIQVYPGAYHNFDDPNRPLRAREGAAFSADGSGRVHQGTDPAARTDSIARTLQFLAR